MPIIILIIIIAIFISCKRKKKKDLERQLHVLMFEWSKDDLPPMYFESLFMSWKDTEEPAQEKIESIKKGYQIAINMLDESESMLEQLNQFNISGWTGVSFSLSSREECDCYHQARSDDELQFEMSTILIAYAALVRNWELFLALSKMERDQILPHEDVLYRGLSFDPNESEYNSKCYEAAKKNAHDGYLLAIQKQWNRIVTAHPEYAKKYYKDKYVKLAGNDEYVWKSWKVFYQKSFLEIRETLLLDKWCDRMNALFANKEKYEPLFSCIRHGVSEYSSIYEIDDFSEEEIKRITELYKTGKMHGFYRKANDPKYNASLK